MKWKKVRIYEPVRKEIHEWPIQIKKELGGVLTRLQKGETIGMPDVRPMPIVSQGVSEIRISERMGSFRTFFIAQSENGILIFHAFEKKTQSMPLQEIKTARLRLKVFLLEIEEQSDGEK